MRTDVTIWFHDDIRDKDIASVGFVHPLSRWQVRAKLDEDLTPDEARRAASALAEAADLANTFNQNPERKPVHERTPHDHD